MNDLTLVERTELETHEAVIARGFDTFVEVGEALVAIREGRLYREQYGTFEQYCRDRWGFSGERARQLMRSAEVIDNLSQSPTQVGVLPTNEREARPLIRLEPEEQREAWQRAVDTAPNGKITVGHVQRVVNEMTQPDPEPEDESGGVEPVGEAVVYSPPAPERLAVHYSSATPEHYTPREIIDAVINCLGAIDLDPCSNSKTEPHVPAAQHFTPEDDGLAQEWHGRVYMNPPYGREIPDWVNKLCDEHEAGRAEEAIALVPARPDTQWWRRLRDYPVCFVVGRLKFGELEDSAPFPSAVFYLGNHIDHFFYAFEHLGDIWQRIEPGMFAQD
jgi:hypothetical protein